MSYHHRLVFRHPAQFGDDNHESSRSEAGVLSALAAGIDTILLGGGGGGGGGKLIYKYLEGRRFYVKT